MKACGPMGFLLWSLYLIDVVQGNMKFLKVEVCKSSNESVVTFEKCSLNEAGTLDMILNIKEPMDHMNVSF
jgi:hypothetical protein